MTVDDDVVLVIVTLELPPFSCSSIPFSQKQ